MALRLSAAGAVLAALTAGTVTMVAGPAAAAGAPCGTEPADGNVYLDCALPTVPNFTDAQQIDLSMGANSLFQGGASIEAIQCEFNNGFGQLGNPPNANFCDAQTLPGGFPYNVHQDGSFDLLGDTGSQAGVYARPDSTLPSATIQCDATHPCVWYVGENYNDFSAPHVFSQPFVIGASSANPLATYTLQSAVIDAHRGTPYGLAFGADGGNSLSPPYKWTVTGALPKGLKLKNGLLSGTPKATAVPGVYPFTVTISTGHNKTTPATTVTNSYSLTLDPNITTADSASFVEGGAGTFEVTVREWTGDSFSESGALPNGVTLTDNGNGTATLGGTPATGTAGTYPIVIDASNGVIPDATQNFTLTVESADMISQQSDIPAATRGVAYGPFTFNVNSAPDFEHLGVYKWSALPSGTLPAGMTFSHGVLAGTPKLSDHPGSFPFTVMWTTHKTKTTAATTFSASFTLTLS